MTSPVEESASRPARSKRPPMKKCFVILTACCLAVCVLFVVTRTSAVIGAVPVPFMIRKPHDAAMTVDANKGYNFNQYEGECNDSNCSLPWIYIITPTYSRTVQLAELTNMCSFLSQARNLIWLLIEDSEQKTKPVTDFLSHCPVQTAHLNVKSKQQPQLTIPQRNLALEWIRNQTSLTGRPGVLYFADDDNTYRPKLLSEMRFTKRISIWPVGFAGGTLVEAPIVENGKVVDWLSGWQGGRKFPIDMAGFAVNVQLLVDNPKHLFAYQWGVGYLETRFIEGFKLETEDLEPRANDCTEVLVWHTQRVRPPTGPGTFKFNRARIRPKFTGV